MGCQGRRGSLCVLCALLLGALGGAGPAAASTIGVGVGFVAESAGTVTFTVTRNADFLAGPTTVDFKTVDGSAKSGSDYAETHGTLTFAGVVLSKSQSQQVSVAVMADTLDEDSESFRLVIDGSEVTAGTATATIADDDPEPTLSVVDSAVVTESAPGAHAQFAVRLPDGGSGKRVTVAYETRDAGATAGQDYTRTAGTLTIDLGVAQGVVDVPVLDDGTDEPAESFQLVLLSATSAKLGSAVVATATIADDDEPPAATPPAAGSTPGATPQTPAIPSNPLPITGPPAPGAGSTTGSSSAGASLGVSSPRLKRPSTVLVTISCPQSAGACKGAITIFSIPNKRSKLKPLRRERRLGRLTFAIAGGRAQTLSLKLGRSDHILLRRTGRMRVRAYALTQDSAGRAGVRTVNGTLIARTSHSSPGRK